MTNALSRRPIALIGVMGLLVLATSARAQTQSPATVRVVSRTVDILSRPTTDGQPLVRVTEGTVLEVVDGDDPWYWVALPVEARTATRQRGWVNARDVQAVSAAEMSSIIHDLNERTHQLEGQGPRASRAGQVRPVNAIPPSPQDRSSTPDRREERTGLSTCW